MGSRHTARHIGHRHGQHQVPPDVTGEGKQGERCEVAGGIEQLGAGRRMQKVKTRHTHQQKHKKAASAGTKKTIVKTNAGANRTQHHGLRTPRETGRMAVALQRSEGGLAIGPWDERDNDRFVQTLQSRSSGSFWVPEPPEPDDRLMARFFAKVGVEILADRLVRGADVHPGDLLEVPELSEIRRFARRGGAPAEWPVHRRRIYDEDAVFGADRYQVLHEYDLLKTDGDEWYAIICLFGEEFAINLGGPSIDGYEKHLQTTAEASPLYRGGELTELLALAGTQQAPFRRFPA